MEQKVSCTNCGAELLPETRFCRQCGQRSTHIAPGTVTDATNKILKTPDARAAFEQQYNPPAGGLSPQGQTQMISSATTHHLAPAGQQSHTWLYIMLSVAFAALLATVLIVGLWSRSSVRIIRHGPTTEQPQAPTAPPAPPAQPAPPAAPGEISDSLIYPGAQTTLNLNGKDGRVLQLQSSDPMDKVVNWYTDKLKLTNKGQYGKVVTLQGDSTNVVISNSGNRTNIIITQDSD